MATTRYKLMEQIQRRLAGGNVIGGQYPHRMELFEAINQEINYRLKAQWWEGMNVDGQRIPDGYVMASYDGVAVESYKNVSRAILPAMPVMLPRNLGVYYVGPTNGTDTSGNNNDLDTPYIPIPAGLKFALNAEALISDLLGQYGYEIFGKYIIFTADLTRESPAVTQVFIRLIVMDLSEYTDYEALPIPADMEAGIVDAVVQKWLGQPVAAKLNDQVTGQKIEKQ